MANAVRVSVAVAMAVALVAGAGGGLAAPIVVNPSFEANTFPTWPGYITGAGNGPITGWTSSGGGGTGLNPAGGSAPFADNGTRPSAADVGATPNPTNGNQIALIQSGPVTSLSQAISGFDPDAWYVLDYRENERNNQASTLVVTMDATTLVPAHTVRSVGGTNQYHNIRSAPFTLGTATSGTLSFTASSGGDNTVLLDNVKFTKIASGSITVLFQDTFSDEFAAPDNNVMNSQIPGTRQCGMVAPLTYLELTISSGGADWRTQIDNQGNPDTALLASGSGGGVRSVWIAPNHNFVDPSPGYSLAIGQVIQCSLDPTTNGYEALIFGMSAPSPSRSVALSLAENSTGFGFELLDSGDWRLYDAAALAAQGTVNSVHGGFYDVRAELDLLNFSNGSPLTLRMYVDDILELTYSSTARGFNYIGVEQFGTDDVLRVSWVDNLLVYNVNAVIPEPASGALVGLGLAALAARRRRRQA